MAATASAHRVYGSVSDHLGPWLPILPSTRAAGPCTRPFRFGLASGGRPTGRYFSGLRRTLCLARTSSTLHRLALPLFCWPHHSSSHARLRPVAATALCSVYPPPPFSSTRHSPPRRSRSRSRHRIRSQRYPALAYYRLFVLLSTSVLLVRSSQHFARHRLPSLRLCSVALPTAHLGN